MVLFKDLAKGSIDLLTNDFPHDKPWLIETKHKSSVSKTEFTSTCGCSRSNAVKTTTSMKINEGGIKGEIKIGGKGETMLDACYNAHKYVNGLTLGTKFDRADMGKSMREALDLYVEYGANERIHTKTFVNPMTATFNSSLTVQCNQPNTVVVGGEVNGGVSVKTLKFGVGTSYTQKIQQNLWTVALRSNGSVENGFDSVICNAHAASSGKKGPSELGVEVKYTVKSKQTDIKFGGLWYLDPLKESSVKAKIGQDAQLALALSHTFSPSLTGILGVEVDTAKLSAPDSVKYGVKILGTV